MVCRKELTRTVEVCSGIFFLDCGIGLSSEAGSVESEFGELCSSEFERDEGGAKVSSILMANNNGLDRSTKRTRFLYLCE